jgi:hypothetical protein
MPHRQRKSMAHQHKRNVEKVERQIMRRTMVLSRLAARRTPPMQARSAAEPTRAAATATPNRTTVPRAISSHRGEDEDDNDDNEDKENRGFTRVNEEEDYSDELDDDSEATTEPGSKGETDDDEAVEAIYSAVTSDPGVPQTFEEAFFGPNKEFRDQSYMKT